MGLKERVTSVLNDKQLAKRKKIADTVMALDEEMQCLSDEELQAKTEYFKNLLAEGKTLEDILPEAYAVCREAAYRVLGMKPYYVQIIGGVVLNDGNIAEIATGQGKTLVATMPAYLNALTGRGVHVVTVNDYLAKRDSAQMSKVYSFLGLSTGCITHELSMLERQQAYGCDITYGTNNEFGFDYLKDNMVSNPDDMVQRELNFAIIDEADSILIDEARTPLIISGNNRAKNDLYKKADNFIRTLLDEDFEIDEEKNTVSLTDEGIIKCEEYFDIENISAPENMEIHHHMMQALKAHHLMKRDINYVVSDGEVLIVDDFTGRIMPGRRFNDGLHQAIETKEKVKVRGESKTLASITFQNLFRMYGKLSGMTGTAMTEKEEFLEIYNMEVIQVPTNKPEQRIDHPDIVYARSEDKLNALVTMITETHKTGQPILVGTTSVEKSEKLAKRLRINGVKDFSVLNAKEHEKEAEIVAKAGKKGALTIATNMAGRGTDIMLGGNPEFEARKEMEKEGFSEELINFAIGFKHSGSSEEMEARDCYTKLLSKHKKIIEEKKEEICKLGGLCIIGTERHENRRIDNQLRGRAGRQGDPGETLFCVSLDDDLIRIFGSTKLSAIANKMGPGEYIKSRSVSNQIEGSQKRLEAKNFSIRKYVLQYDNVLNKQRNIIYGERRKALFGQDLNNDIVLMSERIVGSILKQITAESKYSEQWNFEVMNDKLSDIFIGIDEVILPDEERESITEEDLKSLIMENVLELLEKKIEEVGPALPSLECKILLNVIDSKWMDHIYDMDKLKQGIGLRGIGGQDPAAEYARIGFDAFEELTESIQEEFIRLVFSLTPATKLVEKTVNDGVEISEYETGTGKKLKIKSESKTDGLKLNI